MKINGGNNLTDLKYHLEKQEELYDDVYPFFEKFKENRDNGQLGGFGVIKNIVMLAEVLSKIRSDSMTAAYRLNQLEVDKEKNDNEAELMRRMNTLMDSPKGKEYKNKIGRTDVNQGYDKLEEIIQKKLNDGSIVVSKLDEQSINNYKESDHGRNKENED